MQAQKKIIVSSLLIMGLLGCESTVKRDKFVPPVGSDFAYEGHLKVQDKPDALDAGVPDIVRARPFNPPPKKEQVIPVASVSAFNAPVHQVIYEIATKFGYQVDIWQGVDGYITIIAIEQPLPVILARLTNQLGLVYEVQDNHIVIKPERPFWKQYKVDYVNIQRNKSDSIVMNMTVGGAVSRSGSGQSNAGSTSIVEIKSEHDFWGTLRANLLNMTTDVNLVNAPAAQAASPAQTSSTSPVAQPAVASSSSTNASSQGANVAGQVQNVQNLTTSPEPAALGTTMPTAISMPQHVPPRHESTVMINREAGLVLVYADSRKHKKIERYIDVLGETTEKQVLIEASVVEVILSDKYQAGIDWSFGSRITTNNLANQVKFDSKSETGFFATLAGGLVKAGGKTLDIGASLKMLQEFGDAKVLSSPKIMAINNQSALLKVVDNYVYFTIETTPAVVSNGVQTSPATYTSTVHTVPVGFMMSVTPFVNDEGEISLNIRPTISRIIDYVNDPNPDLRRVSGDNIESKIPVIREREMETVLKLRDQQTAIIGGLIEDLRDNNRSGVPWLSGVPGFGELFAYRDDEIRKTELVIFIRASIINRPDIENGDLVEFRSILEKRGNERK